MYNGGMSLRGVHKIHLKNLEQGMNSRRQTASGRGRETRHALLYFF
jgi:hypothetical protein